MSALSEQIAELTRLRTDLIASGLVTSRGLTRRAMDLLWDAKESGRELTHGELLQAAAMFFTAAECEALRSG